MDNKYSGMEINIETYLCGMHYEIAKINGRVGIEPDEEPEIAPATIICKAFYCDNPSKYRLGIIIY